MTKPISIPTEDGDKTIDAELFGQYRDEAFGYLDTIESAKNKLKGVIDTLAETTGLKKGTVSKYVKQKHADKVKSLIAEGQTFNALDQVA